ncbi:MAG TPA: tRNA isopentenyl-2-thiomethyl-A-37 hydroxylase MiaE, partial [Pseudomonadales bacterium]|nr:tRNA isopentenyl-2-thiomethyl-A-37 hydroxylase MiaE [Pseudomonadales bacterium]
VSMISHYPDKPELVSAMSELAVEEMSHFREVIKWIHSRGRQLGNDEKDPYVVQFRKAIRRGTDLYLLDQLLIGGIIEARGHERFGLVAEALPAGGLKNFYRAITQSESRHYDVFVNLAYRYLPEEMVTARLDELLNIEAAIVAALPIRAALH